MDLMKLNNTAEGKIKMANIISDIKARADKSLVDYITNVVNNIGSASDLQIFQLMGFSVLFGLFDVYQLTLTQLAKNAVKSGNPNQYIQDWYNKFANVGKNPKFLLPMAWTHSFNIGNYITNSVSTDLSSLVSQIQQEQAQQQQQEQVKFTQRDNTISGNKTNNISGSQQVSSTQFITFGVMCLVGGIIIIKILK